MNDRPVSAWGGATVLMWTVCVVLMGVGTVMGSFTLQNWALIVSAMAATLTVGCFITKQTRAVQDLLFLQRESRDEGLARMPRQRV